MSKEWGIGRRGRFLSDAPGFVMPNGSVIATEDPKLRVIFEYAVKKAWRAWEREHAK